jgi:ubiquinone/menaquinone biosynthesis C-methylase UbiE
MLPPMKQIPLGPDYTVETIGTDAGYDRWAPHYDARPNPVRALSSEAVRRAMGSCAGGLVVDIGAGTGRDAAAIAASGARIIAVEPNAGMLQVAADRFADGHLSARVHCVRGRLEALPLRNVIADHVLMGLVLHYCRDALQVFDHVRRIARTGGTLFMTELHPALIAAGQLAFFDEPDARVRYVMPTYQHPLSSLAQYAEQSGWRLLASEELVASDEIYRAHADQLPGQDTPLLLTATFIAV